MINWLSNVGNDVCLFQNVLEVLTSGNQRDKPNTSNNNSHSVLLVREHFVGVVIS